MRKFLALPIVLLALTATWSGPALGAVPPGKILLGGDTTVEELDRAYAESFPQTLKARGASPTALPDIFGPGAVLRAGNVVMKVTNIGLCGNPFSTSTDPSGQWPGQSSVEYMNAIVLAVGGVEQVNGQTIRRVSYFTEWRPPSLDPEDKIYSTYEGIVNGVRNNDDDGDGKIDEDFLDGRDNDGDGKIDEDYAALGQQMFSHVMTDFSQQSLVANVREQHVPLNLRVEQKTWAYSLTTPNLTNFDVIEYNIKNVSGNTIDSLFVGWLVDFDAGPVLVSNYFQDDQDIPWYPQGWFIYDWTQGGQIRDPRVQKPHSPTTSVRVDSALCQRDTVRINGFSIADDNGDEGRTPGVPSFLLFGYTIDALGQTGPRRVQWRAFRSYTSGTPYNQGGNPSTDNDRYEFMSSTQNVETDETSPKVGLITAEQGDQKGDYVAWCSVGPWLGVANGQTIQVSVGFAIDRGTLQLGTAYRTAYDNYALGSDAARGAYGKFLLDQYPSLNNAFTAQIAYEGVYELNRRFNRTDFHGRETSRIAPPGQQYIQNEECGDAARSVLVTDREFYWFDFDCDYCTGIWDWGIGQGAPRDGGYFQKTWNTSSPPPSPVTNAANSYNFTDNPSRTFLPGKDNSITIAWDNLSEMTPDPAPPNKFDFRGYKLWKVSDWSRPVGSPGPSEEDWSLVADFRLFDYLAPDNTSVESNRLPVAVPCDLPSGTVTSDIPCVYIPSVNSNQLIDLRRGDIWNQQTGQVIRPDAFTLTRIPSSVALVFLEGDVLPGGGVLLTWATNPIVSVTELAGYRVYRLAGGTATPLSSSLIPSGRFLDSEGLPTSRYRVSAVTQKGDEVAVGEVQLKDCQRLPNGSCEQQVGCQVPPTRDVCQPQTRYRYPIGRYSYTDKNVKNGFTYFYSVTAYDSTDVGITESRRSAVEAEGVVPQISTFKGKGVTVVPNPYKGYSAIAQRPSAWDLTPNATDPTGTHIDFYHLPTGSWTIRIYTVSGDLVQTIHSTDQVNESVRPPVTVGDSVLPGYTRQQDDANDGQARWNLISRNGQDIVSGIYLFTVDSSYGIQRGKFVVIR